MIQLNYFDLILSQSNDLIIVELDTLERFIPFYCLNIVCKRSYLKDTVRETY